MNNLNLAGIIKKLKKDYGLTISKRTFIHYQQIGLLPKPFKKAIKGGGISGYYDSALCETIKFINDLKEQGYKLEQIKKKMVEINFTRILDILKRWDFLRLKFPKLDFVSDEALFYNLHELRDNMRQSLTYWDADEKFEVFALKYMVSESSAIMKGLSCAIDILENIKMPDTFADIENVPDKVEKSKLLAENMRGSSQFAYTYFLERTSLNELSIQLMALNFTATIRIAEILGEYDGRTFKQWKTLKREFLEGLEKDLNVDRERLHKLEKTIAQLVKEKDRLRKKI
jgi:DNA-binding transcriptional MerR regulator